MSEALAAKRALRRVMRSKLAVLPVGHGREVGGAVARTIESLEIWRRARAVVLFKALPGEVDTDPLAHAAWASGRIVLLPRMEGRTLAFHEWRSGDPLVAGPHGVLEPAPHRARRSLDEVELIVVPGLAFDRWGGRLGRGAGYYDRALAGPGAQTAPPSMLGIGFALQLVDAVPTTALDVPLDGVVTEEGWIDAVRSRSSADGIRRHEES
jgi:5-formyltetrahydrofolate cyclo-ligase